MIFYVTERTYKKGRNVEHTHPDDFSANFVGLDVSIKIIAMNRGNDGRALIEVYISDSYSTEEKAEYKALILRDCPTFYEKSDTTKAKTAAEEIEPTISWEISGDKIQITI